MGRKRTTGAAGAQAQTQRTPTKGEMAQKLALDILDDIKEFRINVEVSRQQQGDAADASRNSLLTASDFAQKQTDESIIASPYLNYLEKLMMWICWVTAMQVG